jgi:hypothetical protein
MLVLCHFSHDPLEYMQFILTRTTHSLSKVPIWNFLKLHNKILIMN